MSKVYVFGHKNPDSDTICASLAYAKLKQAQGVDAVPVKLGPLNNETKFILQYFHVEEPETLATIRTQVSDLLIDEAVCVPPSASVRVAWDLMQTHKRKTLAVVDEDRQLLGIATLSDITRNFMETVNDTLLAASGATYANIVETLEATLLLGEPSAQLQTGRLIIAAQEHTMVRSYLTSGDIVIANIPENIREAAAGGAQLIVCTCGLLPADADISYARERGCDIMVTAHDTFIAAMRLRQSIPVCFVMSQDHLVTVRQDEFKDDVKERMTKTRYRNYPVLDGEGHVIGMISRYHLLSKNRKQAILVDHNERSQTAPGIEEAEILEIIDHHRLGDIQTNNPILMKNEPVGSTATIIASLYEANGIPIPQDMAGLLLSAILSDTLNFNSPTCTPQDVRMAERLSPIADVVIDDLAKKIINAGSNLRGKKPDEIITGDLKEFRVSKYRIGIAQVYSIESESLNDLMAELLDRMEYHCSKNGMNLLILLVTNLHLGGSLALLAGERQDIFFKAYSLEQTEEAVFLPGVLSRKKQVVPLIMSLEEEL